VTAARAIRCVAVMGATATGKSALAMELAGEFHGEIVSMDSRQVYRGFDIGTAKPTPAERARVPHHLVDTLDPEAPSSAGRHAEAARVALAEIAARGRVPFLVGGTGLYFRALFHGLGPVAIPRAEQERIRAGFAGRSTGDLYADLRARDPERAAALSENDRVRIARSLEIIAYTGRPASEALRRSGPAPDGALYLKLVLTMPRGELRGRIAARTRTLFCAGWPAEVARLLAAGVPGDAPAMQSLGYAELAGAIGAGTDPAACLDLVVVRTQQYAKRQETFFRGERDAVWLDVAEDGAFRRARGLVAAFLAAEGGAAGLNNNLTPSA
jgi:tRNA dimethylallyltransferase